MKEMLCHYIDLATFTHYSLGSYVGYHHQACYSLLKSH